MTSRGFVVFLTIVLAIWAAMHTYVFWRIAATPALAAHVSRRTLVLVALGLWLTYPLARFMHAWHWQTPAHILELFGAIWIGVLFLVFSALLVIDVVTVGGVVFPRVAPGLRAGAIGVAGIFSIVALVQGLRPPVLREYEVALRGLPKERDGLVLVGVSDLHLGSLIGRRWLERLVERVNQLRPDMVVVAGDLVDGNVDHVMPFVPALQQLRAPLGVWAVTGNHEYYAGLDRSLRLLEASGFRVLRDGWAEPVPGLVIAGVDDLTVREPSGQNRASVQKALTNRPPGGTILLSHSPLEADLAAHSGVGLMLSGHTHNGQIWPFKYLVRTRYEYLGGPYDVGPMRLIVCRGTATWGPRMRLWRPSELVRIKLRSLP